MSVRQQLRDSGLFDENDPQRRPVHRGAQCFRLRGAERGASIYATDLGHFQIREGALENGRFPNNARLYAFVHANNFDVSRNNARGFMIRDSHIGEVIEIIRGGLE